MGEVQRSAGDVGDSAAGLLDHELASSVVPDLLAVVGAGRQSKVDGSIAASNGAVFALAVNTKRLGGDAEQVRDLL